MTVEQRLKTVFVGMFGITEKSLYPDISPRELSTWDSLQHINLILAVEEEFGIAVEPEAIQALDTFGKFLLYVREHLT